MGFYKNTIPNQKIGYVSNPVEGLNEYPSPINIRDNQFSDCLDVVPYRENAVKFNYQAVASAVGSGASGYANESIADIGTDGVSYIYSIGNYSRDAFASYAGTTVTVTLANHGLSAGNYFYIEFETISGSGTFQVGYVSDANTFVYTSTTSLTASDNCDIILGYITKINLFTDTYTQSNITSLGYPTYAPDSKVYSSCLFSTEASNYVVFSYSALKKLFYHNGSSVAAVTIPFYPHKLITHANRIFAIDDKNKLWWSAAGDFKDAADWYGSGTTESSVVEDSGYWTVERERKLSEIAVIGNTLYIFGTNSIYAFSGYDYDTFALQVIVPDVGVANGYNVRHLTQTGNVVYFISGNDIYEFDGSTAPRVISRSIEINGTLSNGVLGSIDLTDSNYNFISSDENRVYVSAGAYGILSTHDPVLYVFEIRNRTWWKYSGINTDATGIGTVFAYRYFNSQNRDTTYAVVSDIDSNKFYAFESIGFTGDTIPFVVTKAFSTLPTDKQTLTSLALQFQAAEDADLYIHVQLSTSAEDDDFETIKEYDHYIANGKIETLELFLPIRLVSRASHYRVKIQISNAICYLYNIERRFRTTGRSR